MNANVMTVDTLAPVTQPTLHFIGVSTGASSIQSVFPRWAAHLGLDNARLQGIDVPIHAPVDVYRRITEYISNDPLTAGALVTTHKIDLFQACEDLFDVIDPFATLMGETSCISKREGSLVCHAKDPISSGLTLDGIIPPEHWRQTGADVLCMGAGGSTIAISWYLSQRSRGVERPRRIVVTNRSSARLEHLQHIHSQLDTDTVFEYELTPTATDNDRVLRTMPDGSLVVNATGLGKDAPGSPLSAEATFPANAIAWDLNYRGDLVFLDQARSQADSRGVVAVEGWTYFIHGWTQVIAEVFEIDIPTSGPDFDTLSELARFSR